MRQLVVERNRFAVGFRRPGALQFVGEGEPRLERAGVERSGAAQAGHRLVELAARHVHPARQHHDVDVRRRQLQRALDRRHGRLELAKAKLGQSQIGPRSRLLGHECRGAGELLARVVEQPDFEGREAVIEGARDLFVGFGARRGQRRAAQIQTQRDAGHGERRHDQHAPPRAT